MRNFKTLLHGVATIGFLALTSGCISNTHTDFANMTSSQAQQSQLSNSLGSTGGYNDPKSPSGYLCPSSAIPANVVPDQGGVGYGAGNFRACVSSSNAGMLKIYGYVANQAAYCVIPIQFDAQNQPVVLTNPVDPTQVFSMCGYTQSTGTVFTLPGSNFNGIIIVPQSDLAQMSRCMIQTGYYDCPRYSLGRLR